MTETTRSPSRLEREAMKAYRKGRLDEAIHAFLEARESFALQGDHLKAAEMSNNLCVALIRADRPREALEAVEGTPEIFTTHGDTLRAAQSMGNLGSALQACGDRAGAEKALTSAADMFSTIGDKEGRAQTLKALSQLQLGSGQPLQALISMQAGLEEGGTRSWASRLLQRLLRFASKLLQR